MAMAYGITCGMFRRLWFCSRSAYNLNDWGDPPASWLHRPSLSALYKKQQSAIAAHVLSDASNLRIGVSSLAKPLGCGSQVVGLRASSFPPRSGLDMLGSHGMMRDSLHVVLDSSTTSFWS